MSGFKKTLAGFCASLAVTLAALVLLVFLLGGNPAHPLDGVESLLAICCFLLFVILVVAIYGIAPRLRHVRD